MSYYASLPGSFLPPFFSFGASTDTVEKDEQQETTEPKSDGVDTSHVQVSNSNNIDGVSSPSAPSASYTRSLNNISPSTFKALALSSSDTDDCKASAHIDAQQSHTSPQPSDIIIAIRSARVNPVELIKSLTSTGRNVARRTANFIARTPDIDNNDVTESGVSATGADNEESSKNNEEEEEVSIVSRPGLCYEDTDSDEEYSMYDYSDDFSTPNDDIESDFGHGENASCGSSSDNGDDPSAIEFELSITFQGRKYNATRAFPTFVKLREDLLSEMNNNERHHRSNRRNCSSTLGGGKSHLLDSQYSMGNTDNDAQKEVPELPRVSPESLGHGGYASMSGVARSGFALLQATAQHYCPEMEHWMRQVIDTFPCSQSLSSFLWEPLSSSNAEWETIGEEGNRDVDDEKLNSLNDASGGKPPMHRSKANSPKCKPKPKVNMPTLRKNKSMGSVGSLLSIQEGNDDDVEHDDW